TRHARLPASRCNRRSDGAVREANPPGAGRRLSGVLMRCGIKEVIFLAVMIGLLGCGYQFVFKPADLKREARQAEIQGKRKALSDLRNATMGISDLEHKIGDLQQAIKFFESKLPQEKEIDKILKEVWQMAEKNSLQTRTIKTM